MKEGHEDEYHQRESFHGSPQYVLIISSVSRAIKMPLDGLAEL
jgi:hypothetical protein